MTTAILNALGVSLSEDLMPPTQFNAMGYFESVAISKIHDEILALWGVRGRRASCSSRSDNWWMSSQITPFKRQLVQRK